ncbi:MAG: sulfatase [Porphyromonadaceae bacterium]|nr:sulfatase [Porphyromonadaceae bacterium]
MLKKKYITLLMLFPTLFFSRLQSQSKTEKPNVLFIAVDDLNDWVGYLGGHPDARTPNLDRLAGKGVAFSKAYCAAPSSNPSRASLMTGILPSSSGVYGNSQPFRKSKILKNAITIPQYFMNNGYVAMGSGKIYHDPIPDPESWNYYWPALNLQLPVDPTPPKELLPLNGIPKTEWFDWGPMNVNNEEMGDWQVADWVIGQLQQRHEKPFFLACGLFRPHLPWFVPKEFFDLFPEDKLTLPTINENDLDDIPEIGKKIASPNGDHAKVIKYNQYRKAVQGYLASIAFMDATLGRVLDAFENSRYKNNTILILWSDHGWHLGEKLHWRKFSLWEEATRNNLIIIVPGLTKPNTVCEQPVSLIDIYPTLLELCNLPSKKELQGKSLVPLLKNAQLEWDRPVLTTHGFRNHALRTSRWRYIQYSDGSEELYDHSVDTLEWNNLANKKKYSKVIEDFRRCLPQENESPSASEKFDPFYH